MKKMGINKNKEIEHKIIVITGASSGVGKAAALSFAKMKASIVLASRRGEALDEVAQECEKLGGKAVAVVTDVTSFDSVKNLLDEAIKKFGSVDVWINNAGIGAIGAFDETPLEIHEQILRTNLLGPLYGFYAVIPYFKQQGKGIIINMNSTGAFVGAPFSAAYCASKSGFRGLSESLRYEFKTQSDIHVCDIFASFIDSAGIGHLGNFVGKEVSPVPPLIDPMRVGESMVKLVRKPRSKTHLGVSHRLARVTHLVMPEFLGFMMNKLETFAFKKAKSVPKTPGSLLEPMHDASHVHGS